MKKTICYIFINDSLGGSANVAIKNIAKSSEEFNVVLITNYSNKQYFEAELKQYGVVVHGIKTSFEVDALNRFSRKMTKIFSSANRTAARVIKSIIIQQKASVIHVHSTKALTFISPDDFPNINKIFTLHETGGIIPELEHYFNFGQTLKESIIKLNKFNYITCASEAVIEKIQPFFNPQHSKLVCVRNGLDDVTSPPKKFNEIQALFVGGSNPIKNIYLFIRLLEKIGVNQLKKIEFRLIILGFIDKNLKDYVSLSSVSEQITLVGNVDQTSYFNYMKQSNVYVNTSIHETIPNSLMDAIGHGLVPILTNTSGNLELLTDKNNCIPISSTTNSSDLYDRISEKDTLLKMSENILNIKKEYTWTKINQEYLNIYRK